MSTPRHRVQASCLSMAMAMACSSPAPAPEKGPTTTTPAETAKVRHGAAVAADHGQASATGAAILRQGGTAADAGVATLLALGVLNPFASGLGGGGFCLYRQRDTGRVDVIDFREVAPAKASRDMYLRQGKAVRELSRLGGLAVGVPGEARGLELLHKRYGALPWAAVVEPAIALARDGHTVDKLLPKRLASAERRLAQRPKLDALFRKGDGSYVAEGDTLRRPALAKTLVALRDKGADALHGGPIAQAIAEAAAAQGGILTVGDLAAYAPKTRVALEGSYRKDYRVFTMPPPSSGGVALLQILNILEGYEGLGSKPEAERLHLMAEAMKHAFADRARWLGDSDFVEVPVSKLVAKSYGVELRGRIRPDGVGEQTSYGTERKGELASPPPDDAGTSHVSVLDGQGNMLACTSTVNTSFGSMVLVPDWGIVLNNEMDDFSAAPGVPNSFGLVGSAQNAIAPGKRPLSSMSPTLVVDAQGEPVLIAGASGGPTIISGTLQVMLNVLDRGMSASKAVAAERIHHQWVPPMLFGESADGELHRALQQRGHQIKMGRPGFNSVQVVVRRASGVEAASDPRKLGRAEVVTAEALKRSTKDR